MHPATKKWLVKWRLLGKPRRLPLDMLLNVPVEAFEMATDRARPIIYVSFSDLQFRVEVFYDKQMKSYGVYTFKEPDTPSRDDEIRQYSSLHNARRCIRRMAAREGWIGDDWQGVPELCKQSAVGKHLPGALYVHASAIGELPARLQNLLEGARKHLYILESMAQWNVVKIDWASTRVVYLAYEDFDKVAHPRLLMSYAMDYATMTTKVQDFSTQTNPPILHRKESLVSPTYRGYKKFLKLTQQEERAGLYEDPHVIGRHQGWEATLVACGTEIRGHSVRRRARLG